LAGITAIGFALPAGAEENPALLETLEIMKERGLIDDAKHAELVAKNAAWEASNPGLLSRLEWEGDFRARLENFWYDEDGFGLENQDRTRARYRFRLGAKAKVNDVVTVGFRLASGSDDQRSTNKTFGSGVDFDTDDIRLDKAFAEFSVPGRYLPETMKVKSVVGKQSNPFRWKNGKDFMVWDSDITPEGVGVQISGNPGENLSLFTNAGYFIVDENSSSKDPHVFGIQGGASLFATEDIELGGRASFYDWRSLDECAPGDGCFLDRANQWGSLIADPDDYSVLEIAAYGRFTHIENWPVLVYGHFAQNLDADSAVVGISDDEDIGWGVGVEVGDKKKYVKLGGGYYHVEANFSPPQFTDSDLFDGYTNREGFVVYASRQLFANTDLNVTLFSGEEIEDDPAYNSLITDPDGAERFRLQTDVVVKF
jgi:hypothetical protein